RPRNCRLAERQCPFQPSSILPPGTRTPATQGRAVPKARPAHLQEAQWRARLAGELERSRRYGRSFVIAAVELGPVLGDPAEVVAAELRSLDSFCLEGGNLLVLLSELSFEDATVPLDRLLRALSLVAPSARAGFASSAADGDE